MATLFTLIFFISLFSTIGLVIKPSLTARGNNPALSRGKIALFGLTASILSFALIGVFAPKVEQKLDVEQFSDEQVQVTEQDGKIVVSQKEADQKALELQKQLVERKAELAKEDQPHIKTPTVDYTKAVAKVNLNDDAKIIAAVGKPVVEKESGANQNGEPMTTYYFSDDLRNGLEISLSREFVDVAWKFNAKDKAKSDAAFNDGQRITRALLGGEIGVALYTSIIKGSDIDAMSFEDGTEVNHARCGEYMCRYQVVR
ncbi:hypothetical protein DCO44_09900 [Acinetobacter sp. AM]|uniref:hypothetical protein n=1 Tax=Acinetobacter sp. AM TaxID=2170730 RepID=UPI000DE7942C|nr:hypothetical protein [Acinetobacter sp. AM]PWB14216.1 hypothetical protein DCO44_09900 [Acinetobacter sp. AM]